MNLLNLKIMTDLAVSVVVDGVNKGELLKGVVVDLLSGPQASLGVEPSQVASGASQVANQWSGELAADPEVSVALDALLTAVTRKLVEKGIAGFDLDKVTDALKRRTLN